MARGKDQDSLGMAAEDWVRTRLTRAEVLCMSPQHDRAGYDLTCYFPTAVHGLGSDASWHAQELQASLPYRSDFSVLLQVKASESLSKNPPRVKLDNLQRFAEWPNPAFFLLLEYGKNSEEPQAGYLLHFDEQRVTFALEHLWKLDDKSGQTPHKTRLTLSWTESERLSLLTGQAIRAAMESAIGPDPVNYTRSKQRWCDGVSKKGRRLSFTANFPSEGRNEFESMVDFALGLTTRLPSTLKKVEDVRFGFARPVTLPPPKEVYFTADLKPKAVTIELSPAEQGAITPANIDGTPAFAQLSGHFYHPRSIFPFIPEEHLRYRIAAEHLDLFWTEKTDGRCQFHFRAPDDATKAVQLSSLAEAAEVLRLADACMRSSRELNIRLLMDDEVDPVFWTTPFFGFPADSTVGARHDAEKSEAV